MEAIQPYRWYSLEYWFMQIYICFKLFVLYIFLKYLNSETTTNTKSTVERQRSYLRWPPRRWARYSSVTCSRERRRWRILPGNWYNSWLYSWPGRHCKEYFIQMRVMFKANIKQCVRDFFVVHNSKRALFFVRYFHCASVRLRWSILNIWSYMWIQDEVTVDPEGTCTAINAGHACVCACHMWYILEIKMFTWCLVPQYYGKY